MDYQSNPKRAIGHNRLARMPPIFASWCGLDNQHLHKPLGKRALDITMLSNSTVSEDTKMRASRHANLKTHACYQRPTNKNVNQKYKAMNPLLCTSSDSSKSQEKNSILSSSPKTICNSWPSTITPTSYHQTSSAPMTLVVININTLHLYSFILGNVPHQVATDSLINHPFPNSNDAKDSLTFFF